MAVAPAHLLQVPITVMTDPTWSPVYTNLFILINAQFRELRVWYGIASEIYMIHPPPPPPHHHHHHHHLCNSAEKSCIVMHLHLCKGKQGLFPIFLQLGAKKVAAWCIYIFAKGKGVSWLSPPFFFAIRRKKSWRVMHLQLCKWEGGLFPLFFCNKAQKSCSVMHLHLCKGGGDFSPSFLQLGAKKLQCDASFLQLGAKKVAAWCIYTFAKKGGTFPPLFAIRRKKKLQRDSSFLQLGAKKVAAWWIYIFAKKGGTFPPLFAIRRKKVAVWCIFFAIRRKKSCSVMHLFCK